MTYRITVRTGDESGAGTDANVYMIMYGTNGKSRELALKKTSKFAFNKFERSDTDVFTFDMLSLGELLIFEPLHTMVDSPTELRNWGNTHCLWVLQLRTKKRVTFYQSVVVILLVITTIIYSSR